MIIIHKISDFLFELFPEANSNEESLYKLKLELESYYTFGIYKPIVSIEDGNIQVNIDVPSILNENA